MDRQDSGEETYLGVIDQGTTGAGFVIFDARGTVVSDGFEELHPLMKPSQEIVYDPLEIIQCVKSAMHRALSSGPVGSSDLTTIGIANQRQTIVLWEAESGSPVTPAISWQDRRACPLISELTPEEDALIRERTGLVPDPYFAGATLSHVLANDPTLRQRADAGELRFGTIDAWLLSQLSERHVTDVTNAAQTMLVDIDRIEWDPALLELFNIPSSLLPEIHASSHPSAFGRTDLGGLLDTDIPITAVIGNQQAALVGHGGCVPGVTKISYGSGNFVLQNVGKERVKDADRVLSTIWFQRAGEAPFYGLEAPVFATGRMIEWLDDLELLECEPDLDHEPSLTDRPIVIPTIAGGGSPEWTVDRGGAIFGLTPETDLYSLVAGTLDGIGYATRSALEAIESVSGRRRESVFIDGSPILHDNLAESQAALLGRSLIRPGIPQTSALGAAYAAGLSSGIWDDLASIVADREEDAVFTPCTDHGVLTDRYNQWCRLRDAIGQVGK